jgi:hypothetical protein
VSRVISTSGDYVLFRPIGSKDLLIAGWEQTGERKMHSFVTLWMTFTFIGSDSTQVAQRPVTTRRHHNTRRTAPRRHNRKHPENDTDASTRVRPDSFHEARVALGSIKPKLLEYKFTSCNGVQFYVMPRTHCHHCDKLSYHFDLVLRQPQ